MSLLEGMVGDYGRCQVLGIHQDCLRSIREQSFAFALNHVWPGLFFLSQQDSSFQPSSDSLSSGVV
jgi:hypothetical protein